MLLHFAALISNTVTVANNLIACKRSSALLDTSRTVCCETVVQKSPQSLADLLDVDDPRTEDQRTELQLDDATEAALDISDPKEFCKKILESREFRRYIMHGIVLGNVPPAVITRVMDQGWGKPVENHKHSGDPDAPIVTEIRRVIVHARADVFEQLETSSSIEKKSPVTH